MIKCLLGFWVSHGMKHLFLTHLRFQASSLTLLLSPHFTAEPKWLDFHSKSLSHCTKVSLIKKLALSSQAHTFLSYPADFLILPTSSRPNLCLCPIQQEVNSYNLHLFKISPKHQLQCFSLQRCWRNFCLLDCVAPQGWKDIPSPLGTAESLFS